MKSQTYDCSMSKSNVFPSLIYPAWIRLHFSVRTIISQKLDLEMLVMGNWSPKNVHILTMTSVTRCQIKKIQRAIFVHILSLQLRKNKLVIYWILSGQKEVKHWNWGQNMVRTWSFIRISQNMAINWTIIGQNMDLVRKWSLYGRPTLGTSTNSLKDFKIPEKHSKWVLKRSTGGSFIITSSRRAKLSQ